ncbi:MAG: PHP domain-containing protein [Methanothrix sp.]|nr:PHP domain-containing protein [Methanothrix sp.]MDD4447062.1 PHP domain-containing protein [Methanothrix sp.]
MKLDMHIHTLHSPKCGWMRPEHLIERAIEKGLDGLAVTDHNTIDGAREVFDIVNDEQMKLSVIIGEEISTDRGEVLAYFINREIEPGPFAEVLNEIKRAGGISAIPHPFDKLRHHAVRLTRDDVGLFDCIEGFNARCFSKVYNDLAYNFGKEYDLAITAGSDAHFLNEVGNGGIIIGRENIREAITKNDMTIYGHRSMVINHAGTKILKFRRSIRSYLDE